MEFVCHQKIMRDKIEIEQSFNLFGRWWEDLDLSVDNASVKEITRDKALPIILQYEWLGTLPVNYSKFCGLYFGSTLSGVVCFVDVKFGGRFTLWNYKAVCLGRGACVHFAPTWAASFLIQNSLKLLFKNKNPVYVVAFSDWAAGEIGTIYQSCSWCYLGHKKTKEWVDLNGKRYDINTPSVRAVSGFSRRNNKKLKATKEQRKKQIDIMMSDGYKLVDGPTRGKYATLIGRKCKKFREMRSLLDSNKKPYPKRNHAT